MTTPQHPQTGQYIPPGDGPPSRQAAAPMETAARQYAAGEAALAIGQMTGPGGHAAAVMAPFPGVSVTDRTDPRVAGPSQMDLPPAPDATSKHTGPP